MPKKAPKSFIILGCGIASNIKPTKSVVKFPRATMPHTKNDVGLYVAHFLSYVVMHLAVWSE